ncbi:MAG TPA: long-chain fatty acid--CoA ligase [Bacteroides sp.]|nr:long-chain fatty acid--CoA ligase [Bacteroides sp.]
MEVTRIFDLLDRYKENFIKDDALVTKRDGGWVKFSTEQYIRNSYLISYGLLAMGIKEGDKVITVTNNRPEWNFLDMGINMAGNIHVPVFTSLSESEYKHVLDHSDAKVVFISDKKLYEKISPIAASVKNGLDVYTFDVVEGAKSWEEVLALGEKEESNFKDTVENIKKKAKPEDCATIIYTSGTTGTSKGVMLSHNSLIRNFIAATEIFQLSSGDKFMSILPLCHVGGRMGNYQNQYSGSSIYYAESMATIAVNMREIQPDGFDTVPRILEKIYDTVISKGKKLSGVKKKIFFWAVKLGLKYKPPGESSWFYRKKLGLADKLIFVKWRDALGGKVRIAGCGGASLQPRLERIFWAAGIKIMNMYGLTETSPIITINRQEKPLLKLGTVGALIDGVEVKIAEDGEILCKGHNIMMGYYKDPDLTASAIDSEGWFHTGDIGKLEEDRYLCITDRKKEIFKLSNGKFVAPQPIENRLKESLYIDQLMVVGENEKFASAIISLNISYINEWFESMGKTAPDQDSIIDQPEVIKAIGDDVKRLNSELSEPERILRFKLVSDEWTPASGELSPTLKLRRKFIAEKYNTLLEQIYPSKTGS